MKLTKKVYRTAMGREVDMQSLVLQNEKAVALGNANLNARGDQIDARGNIVKKREELAQDYYRANPKAVRDEPLEEDKMETPVVEAKADKKPKATKKLISEEEGVDDNFDATNLYASEIIKNKERS